jgi:pyruvate/2-oxoglutarate dehydrogenase complex dihydrolipoamide dehydrogenase (E3) component
LIADADWPNKVRDGDLDEVRPCISCNACVDLVANAKEARCAVNPEVGREGTWKIEPAAKPRRVMVVGGGPAGLEAARIARIRGHHVAVWDREPKMGGKLDVASRAPDKDVILRFRDYQVRQLEKLGVKMHTGQEVTPDLIESENPDVVLLASGADPLLPPIPGIEGPNIIDAQELLLDKVTITPGERIAVIGGSATGCETAEHVTVRGAGQVTILDMLPHIGQGIEQITRRHLVSWLRSHGVDMLTRAKVTMIEPNQVLYEQADGQTVSLPVDRVAMAVGWRPRGSKLAGLLNGREVMILGDASRPADFVAAINAGAEAGLTV